MLGTKETIKQINRKLKAGCKVITLRYDIEKDAVSLWEGEPIAYILQKTNKKEIEKLVERWKWL